MIELLAPAKDKLCAKAAVDYGADAVYIGANEFGARKKAANSVEDIKEIVEYAHKFNVRVYVTINTILTDDEVKKAKELIEKLEVIGVDAIIIQDMGLLDDAKCKMQSAKCLKFHASTQCDNRTVEKVKFFENAGFSRVILARELSIEQIKEIKKQTNIELETFIHGALCVSYSGQCYLSYAIGGINGRSANRGECAQPCRKKYSLVDEQGNFIAKDKYLLCLKDFNASKYIKSLAEAGVSSFKIEGRLKDVNYVKNVVAYYRKLIDDLGYEKTSSGKVLLDFEPDLEKSFNRGFTDYFLRDRAETGVWEDSQTQRRLLRGSKTEEIGECYTFESPKSRGKYIGKVTIIGKDYFGIKCTSLRALAKQSSYLSPQDGLCFFNNGELIGCLINKVDKNYIYPNKMDGIKVGAEIYRNFDCEFEKKLNNSKTCRKLGVNIFFDLSKIKAVDEDGTSVEIKYDFDEFAQNNEKMRANILNQLKKAGDTDFWVEEVNILSNKLPFLPVSKINQLRRELLEELMSERLTNYTPLTPNPSPTRGEGRYPFAEIDYKGNVLNKYAKEFYEKHGCKVTEPALEGVNNHGGKCGGKCIMTTKHCLKQAFNICKSPKNLYLIDEKNKRYELKFNCDNCEMEIYF